MNLWILHYSFINHQFHHSTITIKQKIIINKLVTELLWGHFLWKNICLNEKRQIPRKNTNSAVKFRSSNSAAKTQIPRHSAGRGKLWALMMRTMQELVKASPTFLLMVMALNCYQHIYSNVIIISNKTLSSSPSSTTASSLPLLSSSITPSATTNSLSSSLLTASLLNLHHGHHVIVITLRTHYHHHHMVQMTSWGHSLRTSRRKGSPQWGRGSD